VVTPAELGWCPVQGMFWCEKHRVYSLDQVKLVVVATYIENHQGAAPTVKQHLAGPPLKP